MSRRLEVGRPPRYDGSDPYLREMSRWLGNLAEELRLSSEVNDRAVGDAYSISNNTETRSLDGAAATLDETRNALATVVGDLQSKGVLK